MQQPKLLSKIWASLGLKNAIPAKRTGDLAQGAANYEEGFPSITMTPVAQGGKAPSGKDMNGILHELSAHIVHLNQGGQYQFDADFAEMIGGYKKGAVLINNENTAFFVSLVNQNKVDFNRQSYTNAWQKMGGIDRLITSATLTQRGIVQLTNDTLDSESLAFSAKGAKILAQQIAQNRINTTNLANQKVDKSAISDSVSSSSQTSVASSKAVKTAYDQANTKVPIDGDCEMTGTKSFTYQIRIKSNERGSDKYLRFGQNEVDSFIQNPYSGKYLQLRNNGRLQYDSRDVFVKGLQNPHWDDIEGKPNASTHQRGVVQLTDSVNFDSSDWGASAKGLRAVNLKAEAAQRSANEAMTRANAAHHSERSYVDVTANTAGYGGLNIDRPNRGDLFRMESENNQLKFLRMNRISRAIHYAIYFPERNGVVALADEVVRKSGDKMTGDLEVPYLKVKRPHVWINLVSESNNSVGIDFTSHNATHPQSTIESIDVGGFSTEFRFHTTPTGRDYTTNRRQHAATISSSGGIWTRDYGWLHDKFHHSGKDYVGVSANSRGYGGVDILRNSQNDRLRLESEGNGFKFTRMSKNAQEIIYSVKMQEKGGILALLSDVEALKTFLEGNFFNKNRFSNRHYPSHYNGAEVFKIPTSDSGGLMITIMQAGVNSGSEFEFNLPERHEGFAIPVAVDVGYNRRNIGIQMASNNTKVKIYNNNQSLTLNIIVISWGRF